MSFWHIVQCTWQNRETLNDYLRDGWEPFAVTETEYGATVWLRRSSEREPAGIVRPKGRRLESEAARLIDGLDRDLGE
jgi:hypothetical protein